MTDVVDLDFNRLVRCHCGKSEVVSRMRPDLDTFVVCSRECFIRMVNEKPNYWKVMYGEAR